MLFFKAKACPVLNMLRLFVLHITEPITVYQLHETQATCGYIEAARSTPAIAQHLVTDLDLPHFHSD